MKIAVNTRFLLAGKLEGFGRFTYEIMKRVVESHPEVEFYFLFDRPFAKEFVFASNVTPIVLRPPARHPILFKIWFEISVKRYLKKLNPDLFLSPDGFLSLGWNGKQLAVIHDLNFEHYPQDLQRKNRKYLTRYFPLFAKHAGRIATVSNYSAEDISRTYGISREKIDVIYNAADKSFKPIQPYLKEKTIQNLTSGIPYFVFVGSLNPRKNIARMLRAFDNFRSESGRDFKLVVIGDKYWWNRQMEEVFNRMHFKHDVIFTGHLESNEMVNILASSLALIYVSYFEGFGIPVVEALKCGVPVLSGNLTSLPEVGGDAVLYVNPFSEDDITSGMIKLLKNPELREQMIKKGLNQAAKFSWDRSADEMWNSMIKTIKTIG